ncbi:MAG TPA: hypothetical protein VFF67_10145 [Thermoplasmata archaeon]|nr:hypothetical protein [Thermoplasmata archaeon]
MTNCRDVAAFLQGVAGRSVVGQLPDADLASLQQDGLIDVLTSEQKAQLEQEVGQLQAAQQAIAEEESRRQNTAELVADDTRRTHSILFHLQGVDKEEAAVDRLHEEQAALQALEADLAKREADFQALLVKKSELDLISPYDGRFIAATTAGRVALRDLAVALYRVSDDEFPTYWMQAQAIDAELGSISTQAEATQGALRAQLPNVDPTNLWAVAIGLAKQLGTSSSTPFQSFLEAYQAVGPFSTNEENRLLAAEVIATIPVPVANSAFELGGLIRSIEPLGIPLDSAAGVAAILLAGRRADGTYALGPLGQFLGVTASYESAALLAIVNEPYDQLVGAFSGIKQQFASWGYQVSEDTELSSAYLAVSHLPSDTVATKMAILARGVGAYLEYPLVAAAVLASIPVLEANETLSLLEKAYEILGQRAGELSQAELLALSVRLVHGVDVRSVNDIDPTQKLVPPANYPSFRYVGLAPRIWVPMYVAHGAYFSTFSALGGVHPGHVHAVGGGFGAGGFGG